jgi:preprotein translocase subunit SecY
LFKTVANAWKVPEFRKKILFTLFIIVVFRIGSVIPVPFLNQSALANVMNESAADGTALGYLNMLSGGAFASATLFALSITPYINASIIMNLLSVAIKPLERLAKEGEEGRKKLTAITRLLTVGIALLSGTGYYFYLRNSADEAGNRITMYNSGASQVFSAIVIILAFTAGAALLMWLGEQINKKGVGNGISIILFAGIVARMPTIINYLIAYFKEALEYPSLFGQYFVLVPIFVLIFFALVWVIVFMNDSERRIPVQYAKRVIGRKQYGGQNTHIPIKIGATGVMPVIFASSLLSIPSTIQTFLGDRVSTGFWKGFFDAFSTTGWVYCIVYAALILMFAFFYMTIQYNPMEMANNLKQNHGTVPGIRPGRPTAEYISKILTKLTLIGAIFLAVISLVPIVYGAITGMGNLGMGGTSIIILVGVALETVKSLESQMMMRSYKGFLD